jgi:hypothetical protein
MSESRTPPVKQPNLTRRFPLTDPTHSIRVSRTIASTSDELTAEPLVAFGSLPIVDYLEHRRTFPNRRANAGPDQTSMGFRSSAGKVRPPRHPTEGYPQVLIIGLIGFGEPLSSRQ